MKIILTGSTGFVGGEVLAQCRQHAAITSIVVLSRRPLPAIASDDAKVQVVVSKDFKSYSTEVMQKLEGADSCIWSIRATNEESEIEYPLAFARAIQSSRTTTKAETQFRHVHVSGLLAERDQKKALWFMQDIRRNKARQALVGMAEIKMTEFAKQHTNTWQTYIARPAMVRQKHASTIAKISGNILGSVGVDQLAATMIDIAVRGSSQQTYENNDLVRRGKELLSQKRS